MKYLNWNRTLGSYEAEGGEYAFLRYDLETITEEIPGFAPATTDRFLAEAIFIAADDAGRAELALQALPAGFTIAEYFEARSIPFRYPSGIGTTERLAPIRHLAAAHRTAKRPAA